ncbi:hypothetical protein [Tardiphaga sp.]|uniref:hypothetical protein n=1 Tax=Tardiphaga sp. TaxID=1926292 RepID=UPI002634B612|nr:hypothetical protein [Tardiphaga sp.]MDB5620507.1 hypothetical protein [Tardiphaga sp.]
MTLAVWPADLPQYVLVDGFQSGPRGARLKTATDTGPGKQRRRGALMKPVTCSFFASTDELARFYRFWESDTAGGVLPFVMPDRQFDGLALMDENGLVLADENGVPLIAESWWLVQFGQNEPADTPISGVYWRVQFDLVVLP